MTIKRFVAPTMRRALDLVRLEMGPDAIILSSQKVKQGVEVITSSEVDLPTRGAHASKEFSQRFDTEVDTPLGSDHAWQSQQGMEQAAKKYARPALVDDRSFGDEQPKHGLASGKRSTQLAQEIEEARERMLAAKSQSRNERKLTAEDRATERAGEYTQPRSHVTRPESHTDSEDFEKMPTAVDRQMAGLQEQVKQLSPAEPIKHERNNSEQLQSLQSEIADMRMLLEQQMMRSRKDSVEPQVHSMFTSPASEALHGHFSALGIPQDMVKNLVSKVGSGRTLNASWREGLAHLSKQIEVNTTDEINHGGVFAFVGSTGVGKTTTIAKLAARYVLKHGMGKVALITTDTYRVGAHDQLRSLGRILNVPVRVVDQERSLASVVDSLKTFPLVLIDTAGFRQGDPLLVRQEKMLAECSTLKRVLVLACNAQVQTLKASAHAYSRSTISGCILTKLDECASLGEMLGVLIQHKLPVMYATDGQSIPDDLEKATAANLVAKAVALMKGQQHQAKVAVGHP